MNQTKEFNIIKACCATLLYGWYAASMRQTTSVSLISILAWCQCSQSWMEIYLFI